MLPPRSYSDEGEGERKKETEKVEVLQQGINVWNVIGNFLKIAREFIASNLCTFSRAVEI